MRIRTQFIVTMLLFGALLVIMAASAIITNRRVEKVGQQEKIAANIAQGASELGYLANDYLIYREIQQLKRWQSRFGAFSAEVAGLQADRPEQQALVADIQANQKRMKEVFDSVASASDNPSRIQGAAFDSAALQVSWSRMAVQSQGLVSDASRLSQMLRQRRDRITETRTLLMYLMVVLFGVFLLSSYMLTYRRILKSMLTLQDGAAVIGSGNLHFIIEERKSDEIGDLTRAFNRMTSDLKAVTASKADLEREITERKRAEDDLRKALAEAEEGKRILDAMITQLKEAQKDLEGFAYSVSHDLRTPLRAIDGFVRMLIRDHGDRLDQEAQRKFKVVRDNVRKMGQLIDDLLQFSRVGRSELKHSRIDMDRLVREAMEALEAAGAEAGFEIRAEGLPEAYADRALIKQVMVNLLSNAMKFSRENRNAPIEVGAFEKDGEWTYYVKDHGVGFDMRYCDKLFGVFQRLHSEEQFEGTGVGLAIVHRIIHRHGGRIWAEGEPGRGATFFFALPKEIS